MPDLPPEIARLRDGIPTPGLVDAWVRLSDAEGAVRDALARQHAEIVDALERSPENLGLAADFVRALERICELPVVDDSDADRMREIAAEAIRYSGSGPVIPMEGVDDA